MTPTMLLRPLLLAAILAGAPLGAAPGVASADSQGDSAAVAVNTADGSSVFRLSFSVKRIMDSSVDADNAAVAYASCSECRTVAASIQVVLAMADTESLTTDNVAIALNYECSECETLAAAYQFVFGNGEPLRFTAEGNRVLADVRRRLQELRRRDDLTLDQLAAEIDALAEETAEVVRTELVPLGAAAPSGTPPDGASTTPGTAGGAGGAGSDATTTTLAGPTTTSPTASSPTSSTTSSPTSSTTSSTTSTTVTPTSETTTTTTAETGASSTTTSGVQGTP